MSANQLPSSTRPVRDDVYAATARLVDIGRLERRGFVPGHRLAKRRRVLYGSCALPVWLEQASVADRARLGAVHPVRELRWTYTIGELVAMRTVTAADRDALLCLCEAAVTHRKASALLAWSTVLIKSARSENQLVRNPLLAVQRDAAHTIRLLAAEFGLTPSSRSGVRLTTCLHEPGDDLLS